MKVTVDKDLIEQAIKAIEFFASEMTVGQRYTNQGQDALDLPGELRAALAEPAVGPVKKGLFVDLIAQHPGLAEELAAIVIDAPAEPAVGTQWNGLTDIQWMDIVNKNNARYGFSVEDAVHEVVKLTEARLKMNNKPTPPAEVPLLTDEEIAQAWSVGEHNASAATKRRITREIEKAVRQKTGL